MEWQVQIYVDDVGEWYGWAHSEYDPADRASADQAAKVARRYGWKTRVVQVGK